MSILIAILDYAVWLVPIVMFSAPIVWTIVYYAWYLDYKDRKEAASWELISKFFTEHAEEYPDAAASFGMAEFYASPQGYDMVHRIKEAEYYSP